MAESKLREMSMDFSVDIINLVKYLKSNHETIIANQIGRSGTSIGANIHEAQYNRFSLCRTLIHRLILQSSAAIFEGLRSSTFLNAVFRKSLAKRICVWYNLEKQKGDFSMNTRMDRSKLLIGVCRLCEAAQTEKHVKEIKDCNIDIVTDTQGVNMYHNKELLDLFAKYGIGYIADSIVPFRFGSDRYAKGPMAEVYPISVYEKVVKEFFDHPAVWALDCGDEPSALDFPHFAEMVNFVNKSFKNQFAYIDLYPNYAKVAENDDAETYSQLGSTSYEEYIDRYCQLVNTDYICYDHYVYTGSATVKNYYANQ